MIPRGQRRDGDTDDGKSEAEPRSDADGSAHQNEARTTTLSVGSGIAEAVPCGGHPTLGVVVSDASEALLTDPGSAPPTSGNVNGPTGAGRARSPSDARIPARSTLAPERASRDWNSDGPVRSPTPPSPWLTYAEAAAYCGWSIAYLRNLVSAGQIPVYGRPRVRRFRRDMLDLFLTDPDAAMRSFRAERNAHGS